MHVPTVTRALPGETLTKAQKGPNDNLINFQGGQTEAPPAEGVPASVWQRGAGPEHGQPGQ